MSIAVYILEKKYREPENEYRERWGEIETYFKFTSIRLWEYKEKIVSGELLEFAPFLILWSKKGEEEKVLQQEKDLILSKVKSEQLKKDLLALAMTIAHRKFPRDFLWRFFKEETEMLKGATLIDEWIKEGEKKGEKKATLSYIREILEVRFGEVPEQVSKSLLNIEDLSVLRKLHREAIKVADIPSFMRILQEKANKIQK